MTRIWRMLKLFWVSDLIKSREDRPGKYPPALRTPLTWIFPQILAESSSDLLPGETVSEHGVGLAAPCLAVREDGDVFVSKEKLMKKIIQAQTDIRVFL